MNTQASKSKLATGGTEEVRELFGAGAHYGRAKSKRHPSVQPYIFGLKNTVEIFDLEKTRQLLESAQEFIQELGRNQKTILWVSGKMAARVAIKEAAKLTGQPFVAGRWIGGSLTNLPQIRSRVERLENLESQKEKGELARFTKKERLLLDREMEDLDARFGGLRSLTQLPAAMFIVDPREENTATREANQLNIPIVSLAGSDCDLNKVDYPIPANDSAKKSIEYIVKQAAEAYQTGAEEAKRLAE